MNDRSVHVVGDIWNLVETEVCDLAVMQINRDGLSMDCCHWVHGSIVIETNNEVEVEVSIGYILRVICLYGQKIV